MTMNLDDFHPDIIAAIRLLREQNFTDDEKRVLATIIGGGEFVLKGELDIILGEKLRQIMAEMVSPDQIFEGLIAEAARQVLPGSIGKVAGFVNEAGANEFLGKKDKRWIAKQRAKGKPTPPVYTVGGNNVYDIADLIAFVFEQEANGGEPIDRAHWMEMGLNAVTDAISRIRIYLAKEKQAALSAAKERMRRNS